MECNPGEFPDENLFRFIQQRTVHATAIGVERLERIGIVFRRPKDIINIASALLSSILEGAKKDLDYDGLLPLRAHRRNHAPWAGLEEPGKLELLLRTPFTLLHR
jgi:hypothetical protein